VSLQPGDLVTLEPGRSRYCGVSYDRSIWFEITKGMIGMYIGFYGELGGRKSGNHSEIYLFNGRLGLCAAGVMVRVK
jgi:hypothetical protein